MLWLTYYTYFVCIYIPHEIRKRKANWIGHILRRNCLLQRVTEGKIQGGIEVRGRQGRRCRKLLDDLKERRGYSHLKEEALDRTMWRARFGRGFGPVVRQTAKWMNEWIPFHPERRWHILLRKYKQRVPWAFHTFTLQRLQWNIREIWMCNNTMCWNWYVLYCQIPIFHF